MRDAFANEILQLARQDSRIVLLSGDIGNRMFDGFKSEFPDRFYNCGVAEANMVSTAAGLAMTGLVPVVYTIASFLIFRALEQIRIDVAYHHLPVILVGVGGGLAYASNGPTHHAVEDLAVLRAIPEMTLVSPGDAHEVRGALRQLIASAAPAYLRLGKKGEPLVYDILPEDWQIGRAQWIEEGDASVALLVQGPLLHEACMVVRQLQELGVRLPLVHFHTLKPLDTTALNCLASQGVQVFCTLEEHSRIGGLGSAVAEWIAERSEPNSCRLMRLACPDAFLKRTTDTEDAREFLGLNRISIIGQIKDMIKA